MLASNLPRAEPKRRRVGEILNALREGVGETLNVRPAQRRSVGRLETVVILSNEDLLSRQLSDRLNVVDALDDQLTGVLHLRRVR